MGWIFKYWLARHDEKHERDKKDLRDRMDQATREARQREDDLHRELREAVRREKEAREEGERRLKETRESMSRQNQMKLAEIEARKKVIELDLSGFPMKQADERRELDAVLNRRRAEVEAAHAASGEIRQDGLHHARAKVYDERNEQNRKNFDRWAHEEKLRKIEIEQLERQIGELKSAIDAAAPAPASAAGKS